MKKLGFGFMRLPLMDESNQKSIDHDIVNDMVDYFIENGFTYFDTAYPYHFGVSEFAIKKCVVDRYPRESFLLADKMPVWLVKSTADYKKIFDEQLTRCGVEYFDYYLLHTLGEKYYDDCQKHGGFDFMKELKAKGLAKNIGFSFHDKAHVLDKILTQHPEMEFVQLQINYMDWEDESIESRKCYEVAKKHNKPVIVMEPVKGGSIAQVPDKALKLFEGYNKDMSAASWAIRYTASLLDVIVVLSGMSTYDQLVDNVSYMRNFVPLNEEEHRIIEEVKLIIEESMAIPCTVCQYCIENCPKNIPIPQYFSLYNNQWQFSLTPAHMNYYMNLNHNFGKASSCIECRQCEEHCPQHIEIVKWLKEVARTFEKGK